MSRHRDVRNLDLDEVMEEDNYYPEDDQVGLPEMTREQEAQLHICADQICSILGEDIPLTRLEVEEACWYYYFDIEETLDYLLKEITVRKKKSTLKVKNLKEPTAKAVSQAKNNKPVVKKGDQKNKNQTNISIEKPMTQLELDMAGMNLGEIKPRPVSPPPNIKRIDVIKEYNNLKNSLPILNLVIVGHVDAGKSTLMGHLLYKVGKIDERTMKKFERESEKIGKRSFAFAWVLDETAEERERGVTVDIATTEFATTTRKYTVLDAPGHQDFVPNMISGASQADVAVLVVNASVGEFETGFSNGGQTKEHALLIRSMGVKQVAIAVNKLDTCGWSESRFEQIVAHLNTFLSQAGFPPESLTYVPVSGLTGANLVSSVQDKDHPLKTWYQGPSLLEVLDKMEAPKRPIELSLRLPVADFFKGGLGSSSGVTISGRIAQGTLQMGETLRVVPGDEQGYIKVIELGEEQRPWAVAGDQVSITLGGIDILQLRSGSVLCSPDSIPTCTNKFEAQILTFEPKYPITNGYQAILHHQSMDLPACLTKLVAQLDKSNATVIRKSPRALTKNGLANVIITLQASIALEPFSQSKALSRFALRNSGTTVATGIITKALPPV